MVVRIERKDHTNYDEWALYKRLYGGEEIKFNMKVDNKARFQKDKNQEYKTYSGKFERTIKF